jgi:hypothetical protein
MAIYILFTGHTNADDYHFVGPFSTETHASFWGEKQHPNDFWYLIDLENPGAEPPMVLPPMHAQIIPALKRSCHYILCWDETSFHLIGPFSNQEAIDGYLDDINGDHSDGFCPFGPYDDLRWYSVTTGAPPSPPKVFAAPPMEPIPLEVMQREPTKVCRSVASLYELLDRIVTVAGQTCPRREH